MQHFHAVVWIDQDEAHVMHFNPEENEALTVHSKHRRGHLHHRRGELAVLPIGMAQVSSVSLSPEVGATLAKGEEFGFF